MTATILLPNVEQIRHAFEAINRPGEVREIRIVKPKRPASGRRRFYKPMAGWFNDADAVVQSVGDVHGSQTEAIYCTVNPVEPALLARANNRLAEAGSTTADENILHLDFLYVDIDAKRPAGISATDQEKDEALRQRDGIVEYLAEAHGWPEPFMNGDSGNGGSLLFAVDLVNTSENVMLLKRCLDALHAEFPSVDQTTFNPSRLMKLPGTISAKGDPIDGRPWRLSSAAFAGVREVVTLEQLQSLAACAPEPEPRKASPNGRYDGPPRSWAMDDLLRENNLTATPRQTSYGVSYDLDRCLSSDAHTDGACLIEMASGAIDYKCQHNSCIGVRWKALRESGRVRIPGATASQNGHRQEPPPSDAPPPWEPPQPLNDAVALPLFPTERLPAPVRAMVEDLAAAYQVPVDLPAFMALGVLSACTARRVEIEVWKDWREPLNTYSAVALPPGERKTVVLRELSMPLERHERAQIAKMRDVIAEAQAEHDLLEAEYKAAVSTAARTTNDEQRAAEGDARALKVELAKHEVPAVPRILVDDSTPEKLVSLMAEQDGRIALLSAEGGVFEQMAGRYSKGGQPSLDPYLKSHAGDSIRIDRRSREPEYIAGPALTLCVAIQPIVLDGLLENPAFRGRGVVARFLYSLPTPMVGRRNARTGSVSAHVVEAYENVVGRLLELEPAKDDDGSPIPHVMKMSPAASLAMEAFAEQLEPRLSEFGDLGHLADWGGKLAGAIARIAGLLHLATHYRHHTPWTVMVERETVENSIGIADYLIAHAKAVYGRMGADPAIAAAEAVLRWLLERSHSVHLVHSVQGLIITRRDIHRGMRPRFQKPADLDRPLGVLMDHGYLRPVEVEVTGPGRKPGPSFVINPYYLHCDPPSKEAA